MSSHCSRTYTNIFVTVGTTRFDKLIRIIDSECFQVLVHDLYKTKKIVAQIGHGEIVPSSKIPSLTLESFRLKPCIDSDVQKADLVITHCGAGSIMAVLVHKKPTIAVVNDSLMDNHQVELAEIMVDEGPYLMSVMDADLLVSSIPELAWEKIVPFAGFDYSIVAEEIRKSNG